ncbi:MAG: hypothetical protein RLZZ501_460 [Pseudomonadota bacterium]|jgi:hypothetical protein
MANSVNGYVTIQVGVANGQRRLPPAGALSENERNLQAKRLRKDGYSYRRIAAALGMSYATVCHLLDGEEGRTPVTPLSYRLPPPPVVPAPAGLAATPPASLPTGAARLEEMAAQIHQLQQRLDLVLAQNEGQRQGLARLERTLVATVQSENRALGQKIVGSVRGLLERMVPTALRARAAAGEGCGDEPG